jgi:hypothetical protein
VKLQLFLCYNGQLVQQWNNVATPTASTSNLLLGSDAAGHHFEGSIDEFVLYGKLITDKTLQSISGYKPARGSAISLSTTSDMVLPIAPVNNIVSKPFTVEFWGRLTATPVTGGKLLSNNGRVNNNSTGMTIEFSAARKLNVSFGNNGSGWTAFTDAGNVWQVGEWNHVALTAVPNDSIYLYVNGNKAATVKYGTYVSNNSWGLAFGKSINYGQPVQCDLDEFRLWKAAQPLDSIRTRIHQELTGSTDTNLVYYYNFTPATDTTIQSGGTDPYIMKLKNAAITMSTAPVALFQPLQRASVKASWSIRRDVNAGLKLEDAIAGFDNNFVTGKSSDSTVALLSGSLNQYYLKGGWQFNALNIPIANLSIDLSQSLPGYDSIRRIATEYFLLKEKGAMLENVGVGYSNGQKLSFANCFLDTSIYHLGWTVDTSSRLYKHGAALTMMGGHDIQIPYAQVNNVLAGKHTIEFWTRPVLQPTAGGKVLSNLARVNNLTSGMTFEYTDGKSISVVFGDSSANWVNLRTNTPLNLNEWNHIALTVEPNVAAKLYLNGEMKDSVAFGHFIPNQYNLALGKSTYYNNETVGMMDELRIWSRAKSAEEIRNQMHLSLSATSPDLAYNFTFDQADSGYVRNQTPSYDSLPMSNARIIVSTAPIGNIDIAQTYHVTGTWSVRDSMNAGLSVLVSIPDYETNLVVGKDSASGSSVSPTATDKENLNTLWQIDPLKLSLGQFSFDGNVILGSNWTSVKSKALEFYLLKKDAGGQLIVQAIGTLNNDQIEFNAINLEYGYYTLGWKSVTTGIVEMDGRSIQVFPNPTSNFVVLRGLKANEVSSVVVLTATGQAVQSTTSIDGQDLKLNVSGLIPGMYIINIRMKKNHELASMKFIKQ